MSDGQISNHVSMQSRFGSAVPLERFTVNLFVVSPTARLSSFCYFLPSARVYRVNTLRIWSVEFAKYLIKQNEERTRVERPVYKHVYYSVK